MSTGWRVERWTGEKVMGMQTGGPEMWQKHKPPLTVVTHCV